MERTMSTKDLKAKLDRKKPIKVMETLAPERMTVKRMKIFRYASPHDELCSTLTGSTAFARYS